MSALRIGMVTREWPGRGDASGGIGTYFRNLAVGLERCGAEPLVVTGPFRDPTAAEQGSRFPLIHLPEPKVRLARRVVNRLTSADSSYRMALYNNLMQRRAALGRHLPGIIRRYRPDILIAPVWMGELSEASARVGLPFVLRASGNLRRTTRANGETPGRTDRIIHEIEQQAVLDCAGLYAPSRTGLADLLSCTVAPVVPLEVIRSGVDTDLLSPGEATRPDGTCRFLFAGRLEPQKGMGLLARVVPELLEHRRNAEMWFAGRDTPSAPDGTVWQERLRALCTPSAFARCRFLGHVAWRELAALYRQCDAVVIPSVRDNLPNVALEGMASGLAVVASSGAGLAGVIQPDRNGLILHGDDPGAWTAELIRLADDEARRAELGRCARESMERDFNLGAAAQSVVELCKRVLRECAEDGRTRRGVVAEGVGAVAR